MDIQRPVYEMKIATLEDLPEISTMSMKFMETTGYKDYSDKLTIDDLIFRLIMSSQNENIIILKPGVGFLAGMAVPFPFGPHLIASEIAWWIEPDKRGNKDGIELLEAFEYWAKEKAGCTMISMVCLEEEHSKIYEKKGYKLYERAYMKIL